MNIFVISMILVVLYVAFCFFVLKIANWYDNEETFHRIYFLIFPYAYVVNQIQFLLAPYLGYCYSFVFKKTTAWRKSFTVSWSNIFKNSMQGRWECHFQYRNDFTDEHLDFTVIYKPFVFEKTKRKFGSGRKIVGNHDGFRIYFSYYEKGESVLRKTINTYSPDPK